MKILYLMHIPWGWIKQRPHFFAEMLSKDFDVVIFFKRAWKFKKEHVCNNGGRDLNISSFIVFPFERVPFLSKLSFGKWLNVCLIRLQLRDINSYDCFWFTSVLMYHYLAPFIKQNQKVIYDCMDDELEFPAVKKNPVLHAKIAKLEKDLLNRANLVFCSAYYLEQKIKMRTGVKKEKCFILNNAIQLPEKKKFDNDYPEEILLKIESLNVLQNVFMYVGTISEWFDFELILSMLEKNPKANVVLIGPNEVEIPTHQNIHYLGTIERKYIFSFLEKADCLLMPFVINELIRSVNPVKLYEYIYTNKIVIAPLYEETRQFEPYIYVYSSCEQFYELCFSVVEDRIMGKNKMGMNQEFVQNNTWDKRYHIIKSKIKKL